MCAWDPSFFLGTIFIHESTELNGSSFCEFLNSGSLRLFVSTVILPYMGRDAFDALVTKTFGIVDGPFLEKPTLSQRVLEDSGWCPVLCKWRGDLKAPLCDADGR